MAEVTTQEPIILDSTGRQIVEGLNDIASKLQGETVTPTIVLRDTVNEPPMLDATGAAMIEAVGNIGVGVVKLKSEIDEFGDNLPGTVQTVNFGTDGKPSSIVHTANGAMVRTDSFTWGTGTVTETRTLADGKYVTIVTDLTTLVTTISAIQEGA